MWRICVEDYPPGYNVDSIRVHVVNTGIVEIIGEELRYIKLTYRPSYFSPQYRIDSVLERIGSVNRYLFNFHPAFFMTCDYAYSTGLRCYEDDLLGLVSTGISDSCNQILTGIHMPDPNVIVSVYPYPAQGGYMRCIRHGRPYTLHLFNTDGRLIRSALTQGSRHHLTMNNNKAGLYFLVLTDNDGARIVR